MEVAEMKEKFGELMADLEKSQVALRRRQTALDECCRRINTKRAKSNQIREEMGKTIKQKEDDIKNIIQAKSRLEQEIPSLNDEIEYANEVVDDQLRTLELKQLHFDALSSLISKSKTILEKSNSITDGELERLKEAIKTYEDNLGLKIRFVSQGSSKSGPTFRVAFSNISLKLDQEFVLFVSVEKNGKFKIVESRPNVDLNVGDDEDSFEHLVIKARIQLKQLYS